MMITGNNLLDVAIAWYRDNGAVQIPEFSKVGTSSVHGTCYYQDKDFDVKTTFEDGSDNSINAVPGSVIPLLAAISLGFDSITLAKIISDHSIILQEITGMAFADSLTTGIQMADGSGLLSPVKISIEAMKAFSINLDNWYTLSMSIRDKPFALESLGIMHTKESTLWPVNLITEHAEKVMTPSNGTIWSTYNGFDHTVSAPQARSELPNRSPIELLRRNGMLSEPVIRKQTGLFEHWEDLAFTAGNEHEMQLEILQSLAMVAHKPTLDLITRGIRSISVDSTRDEMDGCLVYKTLKNALSANKAFDIVFDSRVLLLNMVTITSFEGNNLLEDMAASPDMFDPVLDQKHLLVSKIAQELLARPPHQLGYSDYAVFRKMRRMNLPPQAITFSPEKLVNHILDSMNTYVSPNKLDCVNKKNVDLLASEGISAMASLLINHHDFDYTQLDQRSENAKIHLIRGGFDIKKFTGLSNRAKGLILEEQMGL